VFFGAAAIFDEKTEVRLREQWQAVADAGIHTIMPALDYPPHLTLMGAEGFEMDALRSAVAQFCEQTAPLVVHLASIGVFPGDNGVVFLTPTADRALLDFHDAFWRMTGPLIQGASSYRPDDWSPHVTMAYPLRPRQVSAAVDTLARGWQPISARIEGILFGTYNLQGSSVLETLKLRGGGV
jgi:2'-5' RNA ligase